MNNHTEINALEVIMRQADSALSESASIMQELANSSDFSDSTEDSPEQQLKTLQLILEYRLDTEDALMKLMQLEKSLLQTLGIEHLASSAVNLERITYALGKDDLRQVLSALRSLASSVMRAAYKSQQNSKLLTNQKSQLSRENKHTKSNQNLQHAVNKQKQFTVQLDELNLSLELLTQREAIGPVLDHIAALRGPISRFYQLMLSGLRQSFPLYNQLSISPSLNKLPDTILQASEQALRQVHDYKQANKLFHPVKMDIPQDTLDERAAKRRLGHFFTF